MKTPDEIANEIVMTHTGLYALEKDRERMVERIAAAIRAYATGARAMTGPTSNLRQSVAIVIADALGEGIHYERPGFQRAADASIAAYRAHPAGAAADRHPTERALNNLLAIIHRDGGHHTGNVGINTSVKDAHLVWAELITRAEKAEAERDVWKDRAEAALARLPDGMEHCTILFHECAVGHGWLTADNWVQHGCPFCARKKAEAERDAAITAGLHWQQQARDAVYTAGWIASRDAAAEKCEAAIRAHTVTHGPSGPSWNISSLLDATVPAIRALTPPEPAP